MKKLTKEQSEFLIGKVDRIFLMENKEALFKDKVVKIINECTEQEFPEYNFKPQDEFWSISLSLFEKGEMSDNRVRILLIDEDERSINLYPKEFKCNKIVECLEN